jgi:hypothetical protein
MGCWYQTMKDFAGPVATAIAAWAAAYFAYRLGQNQITVAKAQADIAERNWQTENEKVVLELMERRLAIYKNIREVIAEVIGHRGHSRSASYNPNQTPKNDAPQ